MDNVKEILAKITQIHIETGEVLGDMASHGLDLSDVAEQTRKRYADQIKQLEKELELITIAVPTDEDIDEQLRQLRIEDGDEDTEDPDTQYSDYGQGELS